MRAAGRPEGYQSLLSDDSIPKGLNQCKLIERMFFNNANIQQNVKMAAPLSTGVENSLQRRNPALI